MNLRLYLKFGILSLRSQYIANIQKYGLEKPFFASFYFSSITLKCRSLKVFMR